MEYKIIEIISFSGLDVNYQISYYLPSTDKFYLLSFIFDSTNRKTVHMVPTVQDMIITDKLKKEDIINQFIIRKHHLSKEYTYEQIKKFINPDTLLKFIREYKINELLS